MIFDPRIFDQYKESGPPEEGIRDELLKKEYAGLLNFDILTSNIPIFTSVLGVVDTIDERDQKYIVIKEKNLTKFIPVDF